MKKRVLATAMLALIAGGCAYYQKSQQKAQYKKPSKPSSKPAESAKVKVESVKKTGEETVKTVEASAEKVKATESTEAKNNLELAQDEFALSGEFRWAFYLGPIKQTSIHIFAKDYIDYRMRGKAHSTDYRMSKLSYDDASKKWIGQSEDGTVYVLFFKDISEQAISLYKHKCAQGEEGIAEATAFARPADDETKDHGWNVYTAEGIDEQEDVLPFAGSYQTTSETAEEQTQIDISDAQAIYQDTAYAKLTHHTGEKRWVGQADGELLVVFYQPINEECDSVELAIEVFDTSGENGAENEEKAYKIKHDEQTYQTFQAK